MKHIIRDTNETKDAAAILATYEEIVGLGGNKFQLFYDYDSSQPIPKDEALTYIASGKACFIFEAYEDGKPKSFMNVAGKLKMVLDDSCPNGYYLEPIEESGGSSESDSSGSSKLGDIVVHIDESGNSEITSYSLATGNIYDLIKAGAMDDIYEALGGKVICATFHTEFGGLGSTVPGIIVLPFCSAMVLTEYNGVHLGYISFTGMLDHREGEAEPVTLRFVVGLNDTNITEEMQMQLPH